jgi:nitroreductase
MEVLEAIYNRRSVPKVKSEPVPRELVEKLLSAGVQAPNHHRVRPWRFVVLSGMAREKLGEVMAETLSKSKPETPKEALDVERSRPLRAPLIIAVGVDKPKDPKVIEVENVCAAAAAAQNILLASHGMGLASMWRTGPAATDPNVKSFLGLRGDEHLIGFLYIGYPEAEPAQAERPGFKDRTTWMD